VTRLCRLFTVTRAGFYASRRRPVSAPRRQDRVLLEAMRAIFESSGGTYGSPRIQEGLAGRGHRVSRRRVERLMRADGLRARDSHVTRATLDAALRRRRPDAGLIFHSDRGSEFQGTPVRMRLAASGVRQSMTRGGAPGENARIWSRSSTHSRPT
jgi:transposase InsO family protein